MASEPASLTACIGAARHFTVISRKQGENYRQVAKVSRYIADALFNNKETQNSVRIGQPDPEPTGIIKTSCVNSA